MTKLIKQQEWSQPAPEEQELRKLIQQHDPLFIFDRKKLGLMGDPPAHIRVEGPLPSREHVYRYPELAKQLIANMLQDMKDREIIERLTAAWLSPIVLVNKPDWE